MNLSRPFILRPVATTLLMAAIFILGWVCFHFLPISALPELEYPTLQVVTHYPGASPEVIVSSVTAPLERQLGQITGLQQMSSTSASGLSLVTLVFSLDTGLDVAEQQVQAAINAASSLLPNDLPYPPIYNKVNPADAPIMMLAVTSSTLSLPKLQNIIDVKLAQKLSRLPGVGLVRISGGQRPAMRVQANSRALAAHGLTLDDLRMAIALGNVNQAKGSFDGPYTASSIDANDQLKTAKEYRELIIAWKNGAAIRLSDVAEVREGAEDTRLIAWANQKPALILLLQRQPGANVIQVVDRIKHLLPELQETLPASVQVKLLTDRTLSIRASVKDTGVELVLAVVLVVFVVLVFLRDTRATIIPGVAVPLSLVGAFVVMYMLGLSINNLTLMALTIATGFVVDDAIVMVENIKRYIEAGSAPLMAALKGSAQIGFTIISLTLSLIAVLIPLLFMEDMVGRLFRDFALTLVASILISAFISLTLTPMMCARWLKPAVSDSINTSISLGEAFFKYVVAYYARTLTWVLGHQRVILWATLATLLLTAGLYVMVPKGFFPIQDNGIIQVNTKARQTISFQAMAECQRQLAAVILQDPAVENLASFVGVDEDNPAVNTGRMMINLKPLPLRDKLPVVLARLQQRAVSVEGITPYWQPLQDLTLETNVSLGQYQLTLQANQLNELSTWIPRLLNRLRQLPELVDIASDWQDRGNQLYVNIDRDKASQLGITMDKIDEALYNAFGQRFISTIFTQNHQYRVVLEEKPTQRGPAKLDEIYVTADNGVPVPITSVARVEEQLAPLVLNRLGQRPRATISFNLASGVPLDLAVSAIERAKASLALPESVESHFQGAALAFQASLSNTLWLFLAAIMTMYIVLGILYESYIHPLTILSTLPTAGIGALLALMLSGNQLNIIAVIGLILLIGIVKKNAIMMIDFALDAQRQQGLAAQDAIYQACLLRFRPILMTTMAALLGALPLMLSQGVGAEIRHPLGIIMVGGLIVSQLLTLFTTPVVYLALERFSRQADPKTVVTGRSIE